VLAVLALMDGLFEEYGLQRLRAKVREDGVRVMDFNKRLGYVVEGAVEGEAGFIWLSVTREGYYAGAKGLREMAERIGKG
jgi:RimJ/RimL family protein N-acetyltransferase